MLLRMKSNLGNEPEFNGAEASHAYSNSRNGGQGFALSPSSIVEIAPDKTEAENSSDARTDPTGANDVYRGKAASWRFAGVAAEARAGIHREASCGGDFVDHSR
jgi:hypothetical protein